MIDLNKFPEEIKIAETARDNSLGKIDEIFEAYRGKYNDEQMPENFPQEYVGLMMGQLAYRNPRYRIKSRQPVKYGADARACEIGLNSWCEETELASKLAQGVPNYLIAYSPFLMTMERVPGITGYGDEELNPLVRPCIDPLSVREFIYDPLAKSWDRCRFFGHAWATDKNDLIDGVSPEDGWDIDKLKGLPVDTYLNKLDEAKLQSAPQRNRVVLYSVWIPELRLSQEPGYHGAILTIACGKDGANDFMVRAPQPAFCPPWGPYIVEGVYPDPSRATPMSPIFQVWDRCKANNAFIGAAAIDAKNYKHFGYGSTANPGDANRVVDVKHGQFVLLDDSKNVGDMELGGVTEQQMKWIESTRSMLDRATGITDFMKGDITNATATEVGEAASYANYRIDWVKQPWTRLVKKIGASVVHAMCYSPNVMIHAGGGQDEIGPYDQTVVGGMQPGDDGQSFYSMEFDIEPMSLESVSRDKMRAEATGEMEMWANLAPAIAQFPQVNWRDLIDRYGRSKDEQDYGTVMLGTAPVGVPPMGMSGMPPPQMPMGQPPANPQQIPPQMQGAA